MAQIDRADRLEVSHEQVWADRMISLSWAWVGLTAFGCLAVFTAGPVDQSGDPAMALRVFIAGALVISNIPVIGVLRGIVSIIRLLAIQTKATLRSRIENEVE